MTGLLSHVAVRYGLSPIRSVTSVTYGPCESEPGRFIVTRGNESSGSFCSRPVSPACRSGNLGGGRGSFSCCGHTEEGKAIDRR